MTEYDRYREAYLENEATFKEQIKDCETKAYEYGVLVVRTAVLVSGGALVAIPALIGVSTQIEIELPSAARSGAWFAASLLFAILGAYIIHINWMLHAAVWQKYWEERQEYLEQVFLEGKSPKIYDASKNYNGFWISITFYIPHVLAALYLGAVMIGFYTLYSAVGVLS